MGKVFRLTEKSDVHILDPYDFYDFLSMKESNDPGIFIVKYQTSDKKDLIYVGPAVSLADVLTNKFGKKLNGAAPQAIVIRLKGFKVTDDFINNLSFKIIHSIFKNNTSDIPAEMLAFLSERPMKKSQRDHIEKIVSSFESVLF